MTRPLPSIQMFNVFMLATMMVLVCTADIGYKYERPHRLQKALENNEVIHYFGVGSNMLKSKVINRGVNGTKLSIRSIVPAVAANFRLAFNMRGFPPIEPGMGGIEPCMGRSCHGALIELEATEYIKLWLTEGGGQAQPGYQEVYIDAYRYGSIEPVPAIALRAAEHARLSKDANPSERYMKILIEGAEELGLDEEYITNLRNIKTAKPSPLLRWLTIQHLHFTSMLFRRQWRPVYKAISALLWKFYSPSSSYIIKTASELAMGFVLLPGALVGIGIQVINRIQGKESPSFFRSLIDTKPKVAK